MTPFVLTAALAYLIGSSNLAYYLSRWKREDMRRKGSGNLGTSNAVIVLGWWAGILVFIHDAGKVILAVILAKHLFPDLPMIGFVAGVAGVLGHIYPFYLKFRGGKGFASFLGMIFALNWKFFFVIVLMIVVLTLVTDYIVVSTVATVVVYPAYIAWQLSWVPACIILVATLIILYKHRENYVRIWNGTEIGFRSAGAKK